MFSKKALCLTLVLALPLTAAGADARPRGGRRGGGPPAGQGDVHRAPDAGNQTARDRRFGRQGERRGGGGGPGARGRRRFRRGIDSSSPTARERRFGQQGDRRGRRRGQFRRRFDADGNGRLSEAERGQARAAAARRFEEAGLSSQFEAAQTARQRLREARESGDAAALESARQELRHARETLRSAAREAGLQPRGRGQQSTGGRQGQHRERLLRRFDADRDGRLSEAERTRARSEAARHFSELGLTAQFEAVQSAREALRAARESGDQAAISQARETLRAARRRLREARRQTRGTGPGADGAVLEPSPGLEPELAP